MASPLVPVGRVGRPHGVHGDVRVIAYNPATELFLPGREVHVGASVYRVRAARPNGDALTVTFEGVGTREAAAALTGAEIAVPREALPAPADGELYLVDLVGCACFASGADLGVVVGVETYPASTCLVVESEAGIREIPAVAPYLAAVDLAARRLEIAHADDFPVERRRAKKTP